MKTCILYIRVSTDEQAERGYSQRYQEEVLTRFCQINNIEIKFTIFEDHSAKTINRPSWNRLITLVNSTTTKRPDMVLFTKWDRFSRNAADAYQMIRFLNSLSVEPQAIEQPIDLNIPENKIMLAFYLAAPEVENDRRALNVVRGMRRAKKEGRWMSGAPYGYKNKTTEAGQRYIYPIEPQSSQISWALNEIAKGVFSVRQVFTKAQKRGLSCGINNFYNLIRNPVYCGKIAIPANNAEIAYWADGQHEAIVSIAVFNQVQQVVNKSARTSNKKRLEIPVQLYLRGFLTCPRCTLKLTGSRSTGRSGKYYYYHCQSKCGYRAKAELVNRAFEKKLEYWNAKPGFSKLYEVILKECKRQRGLLNEHDKNSAENYINHLQNEKRNARQSFVDGNLKVDDFIEIEKLMQSQINEYQKIINANGDYPEHFLWDKKRRDFARLNIDDFIKVANVVDKRQVINIFFCKDIIYDNEFFKINEVKPIANIIYGQISESHS